MSETKEKPNLHGYEPSAGLCAPHLRGPSLQGRVERLASACEAQATSCDAGWIADQEVANMLRRLLNG